MNEVSEVRDIVVVAARGAYPIYLKYSIYFCQPGRSIRPVDRLGFYTGNEIKREFPRIIARRNDLGWDRATIQMFGASGVADDLAMASAMARILSDGVLPEGATDQLFLLTPPRHPETLVLDAPILNTSRSASGRRIAWTQGQRYLSTAVLTTNPETTDYLRLVDRPMVEDDRPPPDATNRPVRRGVKQREVSLMAGPAPSAPTGWRAQLRELHEASLAVDWETHLAALNVRLDLTGEHALSTTDVGLPPAWFNGDIEAIREGAWTLVVSLNPGKPPAGFYGDDLRRDNGWDFWRRHNEGRWWYRRFFGPLVRVAAMALGETVEAADEPHYATERMVFVELCPFASRRFALSDQTVAALARDDRGFQTAARFRRILMEEGRPALVLVNGTAAIRDAEAVDGDRLSWEQVSYQSPIVSRSDARPKRLWHMQGSYATMHGVTPVVGFPFLKKPATHNATAEIENLGLRIQAFLASMAGKAEA